MPGAAAAGQVHRGSQGRAAAWAGGACLHSARVVQGGQRLKGLVEVGVGCPVVLLLCMQHARLHVHIRLQRPKRSSGTVGPLHLGASPSACRMLDRTSRCIRLQPPKRSAGSACSKPGCTSTAACSACPGYMSQPCLGAWQSCSVLASSKLIAPAARQQSGPALHAWWPLACAPASQAHPPDCTGCSGAQGRAAPGRAGSRS